jgi:hypothetical protein
MCCLLWQEIQPVADHHLPPMGPAYLPGCFCLAAGTWKGVPVAVKRIPIHTLPVCSDNAAVRRQALKEAAITLGLDHPHVVVSADGCPRAKQGLKGLLWLMMPVPLTTHAGHLHFSSGACGQPAISKPGR